MLNLELKQKGLTKAIQNLSNYDQVATQENRRAMGKVVMLVERVAKMNAPVGAVGEVRAKIHGEVREVGPGAVLGVVGGYAKHSLALEEGAGPHWPNIRNLALWVLRKAQVGRKDLERITFLIARKISRRGTKAQPHIGPAIVDNQQKIASILQRALDNIVRRLAG